MTQVRIFLLSKLIVTFRFFIGEGFGRLKLEAGDDAGDVAWTEAKRDMNLYASHSSFIENTVQLRGAVW